MTKPEDVAQWAWDEAEKHRQLWASGPGSIKEAVARAILAATEAEREAIAEMVDVFADTADFSAMNVESESEIVGFRLEEGVLRGVAAAIRTRTHP